MGRSTRAAEYLRRPSAADLIGKDGQMLLASELPRRIREALESFSVDADGRVRNFSFKPWRWRTRAYSPRRKKRITKKLEREVLRMLDAELVALGGSPLGKTRRRTGVRQA